MNLKDILKSLINICKEVDITPSDDCLIENSVKIYISNKINESKKENIRDMKDIKELNKIVQKPYSENKGIPATDKQISFLERNGIEIRDLSKSEATRIIKETIELKNKLKGGKYEQTKRKQEQNQDY